MTPRICKIKSITKSNKKSCKSVLPTLEKVKAVSTCEPSTILDDDGILMVMDKRYYGRTFSVKDEGIYTVRLGAFHNMDKGALEEAAMFCAIPEKAAYEQRITAAIDIPGASARFLDSIILKAARPFTIRLIPGSPILERHAHPWGVPLKYDSIKADDLTILVRTGLRKHIPSQYRAYFDVLSIQIEVVFEK